MHAPHTSPTPPATPPKPADRTKITRRQEAMIEALLGHPTRRAACAAAGVPERTVRHWFRRRPAFVREYQARRRELYDQVVEAAARLALAALATLARNMSCGIPPAENRAAIALLEIAREARDADLDARLADLERQARKRPQP
jgi:hypothetical protein